jgi:predicted nucleic acid-binding protein
MTQTVAQLVSRGEAAVAGIIKLELLSGANPAEIELLEHSLDLLPLLATSETHYARAGRLGAELRANGMSIPSTDLLIAILAIDHGVPLLHCDRHFDHIAESTELQVRRA